MKKITALALSVCIILCFSRYSQTPKQDPNQSNPDSVKKIIIALNDECYRTLGNPEKYQSFCEDSMLVVGDDMFMTSSNALSHDLLHIYALPQDYTFKLFGNTAVISYLWVGYDLNNGDTIFHNLRNLRTFVYNNEKWKVASNSFGKVSVNYFKPVAEINQKNYPSYTGIYKIKPGIYDTVFVKDGKLYDKSGGDATWDFPVNNSEYMTSENLDRITFGKDSGGAIAYVTVIEPDGQSFRCPKIK